MVYARPKLPIRNSGFQEHQISRLDEPIHILIHILPLNLLCKLDKAPTRLFWRLYGEPTLAKPTNAEIPKRKYDQWQLMTIIIVTEDSPITGGFRITRVTDNNGIGHFMLPGLHNQVSDDEH